MYLPQAAPKSSTEALNVLGGVVSRLATDAVENSSQIADRQSIIIFIGGKIKKGLDSSVFTIRENHQNRVRNFVHYFCLKNLRFVCISTFDIL